MILKLTGLRLIIFGLVATTLLFTPALVLANCGNINTIDSFGEAVSTQIDDCDNPFGATETVSFNASLVLSEQTVVGGGEYAIATTSSITGSYEVDKDFNFAFN